MVSHANLTAHDHEITYLNRSGNSDVSRERALSANPYIVRDVHEVIEAGARTDDRISPGPTVYCCVRSNLDVIFQNYSAKLRSGQVTPLGNCETKALLTNPRAGEDIHARSDNGMADGGLRTNAAIRAHHNALANHRTGPNPTAGANLRSRTDHGVCSHLGSRVDTGGFRDNAGRVDTGVYRPYRMKKGDDSGPARERIIGNQSGRRLRDQRQRVRVHDDRAGSRLLQCPGIPTITEETDLIGTSEFKRTNTTEQPVPAPCRAADGIRDHRKRMRPSIGKKARVAHADSHCFQLFQPPKGLPRKSAEQNGN
jgi:hypothetical protein